MRERPGSTHLSCDHPVTLVERKKRKAEYAAFELLSTIAQGLVLPIPPSAALRLGIEANAIGIEGGWFNWPINYDPVWLQRCNGFEFS